jgi:hypothetical protein
MRRSAESIPAGAEAVGAAAGGWVGAGVVTSGMGFRLIGDGPSTGIDAARPKTARIIFSHPEPVEGSLLILFGDVHAGNDVRSFDKLRMTGF